MAVTAKSWDRLSRSMNCYVSYSQFPSHTDVVFCIPVKTEHRKMEFTLFDTIRRDSHIVAHWNTGERRSLRPRTVRNPT